MKQIVEQFRDMAKIALENFVDADGTGELQWAKRGKTKCELKIQ